MKKTLAAICTSLSVGCSSQANNSATENVNTAESFILNGYKASHKDFPSIGALVYDAGMSELCTVSMIRKDLALTAAHCLIGDFPTTRYLLYGYDKVFKEGCEECLYPIAVSVAHPKYNELSGEKNRYDLALLLLNKEVTSAKPIALLPPTGFKEILNIKNIVTIAGYGAYKSNAFDFENGKLYAADVPITGYFNDAEIIVGEKDPVKGNACYGDSGGPIYVSFEGKNQLAGVASRIPEKVDGYNQCGYGVVYGIPSLEKEWIESEYKKIRGKYPLVVPEEINPEIPAGCQAAPSQATHNLSSS